MLINRLRSDFPSPIEWKRLVNVNGMQDHYWERAWFEVQRHRTSVHAPWRRREAVRQMNHKGCVHSNGWCIFKARRVMREDYTVVSAYFTLLSHAGQTGAEVLNKVHAGVGAVTLYNYIYSVRCSNQQNVGSMVQW